jgi:predicted Zn-dependent protease
MMDEALKIANGMDIDEIEIYGLRNNISKVRMGDNSILSSYNIIDQGLGIRVVNDDGIGFSATSLTDTREIEKIITEAYKISKIRKIKPGYTLPEIKANTSVEKIHDESMVDLSEEEKLDYANMMLQTSNGVDDRIKDNAGELGFIYYEVIIRNLQNETVRDRATKLEAALTATAKEGDSISEGSDRKYCRTLDSFHPPEIAGNAARSAIERLNPIELREGRYDLIIDPPTTGELCYWFCRYLNPAYAETYYPTLKGRIGEKVANEILNIYDDPTYPGGYNSSSMDDEGVATTQTPLVTDGILRNFIYDTLSAHRADGTTTGNALRTGLWFVINFSLLPGKNYNYETFPDFTNYYIEPGDWSRDEIIEDTKRGLVTESFHYSRISQHIRGDFTTILGRWNLNRVEEGQITTPLKKCRINDNIFRMLRETDAIGDNLLIDSCITPTVKIRDVNISEI